MGNNKSLREMLHEGILVRAIGAHDGVTAILAERAGYEAPWASGLGISTAHGVPDAGLLTMTEFHQEAVQMRHVTSLPIIADVDAGFGDVNVVQRMVKLYEGADIDAVCIEDKQYPKRNSFSGGHVLEAPKVFARKIEVAKNAQQTEQFMVIARLESLIAGAGMEDALLRARIYQAAGADALLIHSRSRNTSEITEFCLRHLEENADTRIFVVPTTFYTARWRDLSCVGVAGAIYANQAVRAAIKAVKGLLSSLDEHGSTFAKEDEIASISELFDLVGMDKILDSEPWNDRVWVKVGRYML